MKRAARKSLEAILEPSRDADPEVRRVAARELCPCEVELDDPVVWERILALTRDPSVASGDSRSTT